jgi:hypothetical protein
MASALLLSGCVHDVMRGSVAMKINDQEGHVSLGRSEVEVGDRVALYDNECSSSSHTTYSSVYEPPCKKVKLGEGQITQVLNENYSVLKADAGTILKEGTIAEKIR